MEGKSSSEELQSILDAIRASDVVESRIELLNKLGDFDISEKSDLISLVECLTTFWEDYTCLDASQCLLNKAILSVALKHLESDISSCQSQFLALGTKASVWCGKHLKMTLMSTEESQEEEHCKLFFQLLLDVLNFSAASYSALTRCLVSVDKESMDVSERFIMEQLNLTKDSISESKRIHSHGSDVIKVVHSVIDAVVRLCGVYAQAIDWSHSYEKLEDKNSMELEGVCEMNHVINITKCTIEKLHEMGIVAANNGGSLVSILNVSWKGVVTLLQLGGGVLAVKVNVSDIISTLISLVNESLKSAAEAWSSPLKETVSATEARRKFLPVKFYLINAVKISALYPCQAYTIYRDLTHCILMISTFKLSMSNERLLKTASEVYTELLEKTSFDLFNSLLNSDQVMRNSKLEVLDSLFVDKSMENADANDHNYPPTLDKIFSLSSQLFSGASTILLGRVALFLSLLRHSVDLEEGIKVEMARKLEWVLNTLIDEGVYSSILVLQIPVLCGSGKNVELAWQPIFSSLLDALKAFMVVVSSSVAWTEVESFLLENLFHPHFLCGEIVMELWCFVIRYAQPEMVTCFFEKLCSLMKLMASSESVLVPGSGMRKLARSISMLVSFGPQLIADHVLKSVIGDDISQLSSVVCLALFMEGFPLNLLSDKLRSAATQRILADYYVFIESFEDKATKTCNDGVFGVPIFALSASLQSLQTSLSDIDVKTLRFLVSIIHNYRVSVDKVTREQCCKLLSETLGIISNMNHLYTSNEMEQVIFELENLFISGPEASDKALYECKPNLARFIGGLAHMQMTVSEQKSNFSATCELYKMMFRERHWALIHLSITALGYFSERCSCGDLWRFVPHDAALSYDLSYGNEANEERFMCEFQIFIEKETAIDINASSSEQLRLLSREGLILKELFQKIFLIKAEAVTCENKVEIADKQPMEIDGERQQNRKRKLPDGIGKGMELLQSGLEVIVTGLSQWQRNQPESSELRDKFVTYCSRLEDEIARLVGLAGSG